MRVRCKVQRHCRLIQFENKRIGCSQGHILHECVDEAGPDADFEKLYMRNGRIVHEPHVQLYRVIANKLIQVGVHVQLGQLYVQIDECVTVGGWIISNYWPPIFILPIHNADCIISISTHRCAPQRRISCTCGVPVMRPPKLALCAHIRIQIRQHAIGAQLHTSFDKGICGKCSWLGFYGRDKAGICNFLGPLIN